MSNPEPLNITDDKIIARDEWLQKTNALYKTSLSPIEKIYLNAVDRPLSLLAGAMLGIKYATNGVPEGLYKEIGTGKSYLSGAFVKAMHQDAPDFSKSSKYQNKFNAISAQAFEQCEDVSNTPKMSQLQPL